MIAPLSGNDLVALAIRAHEKRLQQALGADAGQDIGDIFGPFLAHVEACGLQVFQINVLQFHNRFLHLINWRGIAAVNQVLSGNDGFGVVHAEIAGDGVIVEITSNRFGDIAIEPFIDERLG